MPWQRGELRLRSLTSHYIEGLKPAFPRVDLELGIQAQTPDLITPGTRLGKYEIVHRIAFGGMAEIYLARSSGIEGFEKFVVLKRILPQYAANQEFVRMFLREARLAATLDQANIAHVYDIGETSGIYFFTMEYLHGEDLRWIMRKLALDGKRLPLQQALTIVIGAAAGLHFAHEKKGSDGRPLGIVHRDMSPSNVVVTYDGGVKVVDFGVAKMTADPELSKRYALKGKLAYMSPEQLYNRPLDRRSDLFALGVVLYESTTHTRLFKGQTEVDTIRMVLEGSIPTPSSLDPDYPPELEAIVMHALQKDPDKRYASARDLQLDLEAFARERRLHVSSAGLADWMEKSFGPKREIWHSLSVATAPAPEPAPPPAVIQEPATRIVAHAAVTSSDQAAAPAAAADNSATPITRSLIAQHTATPFRARALTALAGGVGALVIAVAVWFGRSHAAAPSAVGGGGAAGAPVVMLVTERGEVAVEPGTAQTTVAARPASAPPPAIPAAAPAAPAVAPPAAAPAPPRLQRGRRPAANPSAAFSAALARRQGEIQRCFTSFSRGTAATDGDISLRFEVAADGRVTSVAVLPAATAATPLGACLAGIGARTVFAPQPAPVAFRIPLTVERRVAQEDGR